MDIFKNLKNLFPLPMDVYKRSFVSGDQQDSIKVEYYFNRENSHFYAKVLFGNGAEGPPNHAHGGAIASVFDEAMGAVAWLNSFPAMTVRLAVDFHKPVKLESEVLVETWVDQLSGKKVWVKGKMTGIDKTVYAESEGVFVMQTKERFQEMGDLPDDFFEKVANDFNLKLSK
ncbi:MAG: PaaI family thioesterase [bacterium]|nr:PaaI family thioesterase [bacterium]